MQQEWLLSRQAAAVKADFVRQGRELRHRRITPARRDEARAEWDDRDLVAAHEAAVSTICSIGFRTLRPLTLRQVT
jgi:hypothetical protein